MENSRPTQYLNKQAGLLNDTQFSFSYKSVTVSDPGQPQKGTLAYLHQQAVGSQALLGDTQQGAFPGDALRLCLVSILLFSYTNALLTGTSNPSEDEQCQHSVSSLASTTHGNMSRTHAPPYVPTYYYITYVHTTLVGCTWRHI